MSHPPGLIQNLKSRPPGCDMAEAAASQCSIPQNHQRPRPRVHIRPCSGTLPMTNRVQLMFVHHPAADCIPSPDGIFIFSQEGLRPWTGPAGRFPVNSQIRISDSGPGTVRKRSPILEGDWQADSGPFAAPRFRPDWPLSYFRCPLRIPAWGHVGRPPGGKSSTKKTAGLVRERAVEFVIANAETSRRQRDHRQPFPQNPQLWRRCHFTLAIISTARAEFIPTASVQRPLYSGEPCPPPPPAGDSPSSTRPRPFPSGIPSPRPHLH